ncbi:MAG: hypothetical protein ACR2QL_04270 [Woeseiaceae bacterium]
MPNYIFAYHSNGIMPKSPEEGAAHMERYKAWLDGMGDAVVNPGTPLKDSKTVSADGVEDGGGPNPIMGFTEVVANDIDDAVKMAQESPFLEMGTIEVAQIVKM